MFRIILFSSLLLLGGCTSLPDEAKKNDPEFAAVEPHDPSVNINKFGSLFQDSYANNLYSDIKAHRVGDIITVYLEESTSAKKKASTSLEKKNTFSLVFDAIVSPWVTAAPIASGGVTAGYNQKGKFEGDSDADQSNSLQGSITVNVVRVLSNGNLEIRGEKWLMLNNGDEFVRIKGVIRSEDVSYNNSVSSKHVANAQIQYGGTGEFANTQAQGWLSGFFSGPYWPL
ncbi:MAG: flagellar basal body L-ring protein FlgH [Psychromonas sp.]|nr:flagellar basal body L-ring protein FlgH [Psychromonas sp.]